VIEPMTAAWSRLLPELDERQRDKLRHPFTDGSPRQRWSYRPGERVGVDMGELSRGQRSAVHRLLAGVLAPTAYAQAAAIMALEDVLDNAEGHRRGRHHTDYWLALFGEPGGDLPWGWRFEGHHLSVNLTVVNGQVHTGPCFFGANPATVGHGDALLLRPLAAEEALARELLDAMGSAGRSAAVVADSAPGDIRTRAAARVEAVLEPRGVPAGRLSPAAAELLRELAGLYLNRFQQALADLRAVDGDLHFAWEGSLAPGADHYYRVHAPNLLVEYDNTANHVHTVVRHPRTDFGSHPHVD
jgi:hypothetical protein